MKKHIIFSFSILLSSMFLTSCSSEDLEPTLTTIGDAANISSEGDLRGLLIGSLDVLTNSNWYGRDFIIEDEIRGTTVFANGNSGRFTNPAGYRYIADNGLGVWATAYDAIAPANIIINQDLSGIEGDAAAMKSIQAQAQFVRAIAHFDLLRNYGQQHLSGNLGVPIVTEFKGEELSPARNTVEEVKGAIYADLETAYNNISDGSTNKSFPSKWAAKALESRVALYFGEWDRAATAAKQVIDNGGFKILEPDAYVSSWEGSYAANSIFELAFSETDNRGINGLAYIYRGCSYGDVEVLPSVLNLYEEGDVRRGIIANETCRGNTKLINKAKWPETNTQDDNVVVIRIEEIILNYAEALLEQGQTDAAIAELNKITSKRGASAYTSVTKQDILNERRKELIFEGFQFFDYQRTRLAIPVTPGHNNQTEISSTDHRRIFPIPTYELESNANMVQNDGY
ncbi:MAG: RagB/SusD family nutrient uptake outer membrane protein [Flavobacteriaceae bacterium]|nr:RagB/SusD family nutrient uptake outer membrane protein [Flavobacteriaceae bacterium]MCY4253546.1 RagB/SusD family nutrient uptake outer membrane protein [Flavobacteriaceae bacterium]